MRAGSHNGGTHQQYCPKQRRNFAPLDNVSCTGTFKFQRRRKAAPVEDIACHRVPEMQFRSDDEVLRLRGQEFWHFLLPLGYRRHAVGQAR
jgi:hypothetical protein